MRIPAPSSSAGLLRGFAVDFLTAHDLAAAERIMHPDYRLNIGGHLFAGRDHSYLPATGAQLEQFPGLCVTVHDVVIGPDNVAMRFTEHGVSGSDGRAAAWGGITLFRISDGQLCHGWAEEDYFARKRQLKSGVCDAVLPPHPAPWDIACCAPDPWTEALVRDWLAKPAALLGSEGIDEIASAGPRLAALIDPARLEVDQLFTAGSRAAFHARCVGTYRGGFPDIPAGRAGAEIAVPVAGLITIEGGAVHRLQFAADRLGLHRALLPPRHG